MPRDEFGDFQTPAALCAQVVRRLGVDAYARVLEPTCGTGGFLRAVADAATGADPAGPGRRELVGVELQPAYAEQAAAAVPEATVVRGDAFRLDLGQELPWRGRGPLLVLGNPPWVTSADLTRLGASNLPVKTNVKGLRGIEARTGGGNFDVAEYVWLKLIRDLAAERPTIALLGKTQVARNVLAHCAERALPVSGAALFRLDARRWFRAGVDAGLFVLTVDRDRPASYVCAEYADLDAARPAGTFGVVGGRLVSDVAGYERTKDADGACPYEWRQGVKHDAAEVMELLADGGPRRRTGEPVDVEPAYLYPLLKSTDLHRGRTTPVRRLVLPQRALTDDTAGLERTAPRLWAYLTAHAARLDARRSSIYRGRPRFCVFGVGAYTFTPYKVAVSGLHGTPAFRLLGPDAGRPVVFDDTCYFLAFDDPAPAAVACAVLRSEPTRVLLDALTFRDSKRPVTKRLLRRLDLARLATTTDPTLLADAASDLAAAAGLDARPATGTLAAIPRAVHELRERRA